MIVHLQVICIYLPFPSFLPAFFAIHEALLKLQKGRARFLALPNIASFEMRATYGASSGDKWEAQGLRAPRGQDFWLTITVGWQPTARVGGTTAKRRVQEHQGAKT